jgi:hypothetical protein
LTLLSSLLIVSNTVCGIDGVLGGLFGDGLPVALGSFSVAVEPLVEPAAFGVLADAVFVLGFAFAVVFFAVGFFAAGFVAAFFVYVVFFVCLAMILSPLCFFSGN